MHADIPSEIGPARPDGTTHVPPSGVVNCFHDVLVMRWVARHHSR